MNQYLQERHPGIAGLYLLVMLAVILLTGYNDEMIIIFAAIFVCVGSMDVWKNIRRLAGYACVTGFFIFFELIFYHNGQTPFLYVYGVALTVEAVKYGLAAGLLVCALFQWFLYFQEILDNAKITWLIGKKFPVISLMISMVFSYYGKFCRKIEKIKEVWECYGGVEKYGRVKYYGILLSVLLSVMLEDSVDTAQSMRARGYGEGRRRSFCHYPLEPDDFLIAGVGIFFLILLVYTGNSWKIRACILLFPVIYNLYKELQWKFYQSKI